ncbi:hypothetical protein ACTMS0_20775 [Micromonospora sp. H33]
MDLDDVYDCVEYSNVTDAEVDADVVAEARQILGQPHTTDRSNSP